MTLIELFKESNEPDATMFLINAHMVKDHPILANEIAQFTFRVECEGAAPLAAYLTKVLGEADQIRKSKNQIALGYEYALLPSKRIH